ncbi:procathepsin L-like isoform X2 [Scyliorhinus canicula]|uniref:procathepsin L-like isoform X2 n=1 Tax=Scyliorhinus canicula TaxID=7830 RepID=UPI0018F56E99|nr:procathepsin L-like isoform X2 [Scyliorhinus canicula]
MSPRLSIMKLSLFLGCVLLSILVVASGHTFDSKLDEDWKSWKSQNEKQYTEEEETYRRKIWEDTVRYIEQHNLEYSMGKHTFTVGMNQFGDLTTKEFNERMNRFLPTEADNRAEEFETDEFDEDEESDDDEEGGDNVTSVLVDWRVKGYVTPVKDEGRCGSCWAFSTTGAIEGQLFHATKKLIPLSEQNLVDCSGIYGNNGCAGGSMTNAFEYVMRNEGINTAADYPYTATDGKCNFSNKKRVATIRHYIRVRRSSKHLKEAVRRIGPIAVAIDSSGIRFQLYKDGIYANPNCNNYEPNHEALVVGYGRERRSKYWLVKNSWGTGWGEKGYIKMVKGVKRDCGITRYASYPIV